LSFELYRRDLPRIRAARLRQQANNWRGPGGLRLLSFNEGNVADVDGDQQRLRDFLLVGVGRVDSAGGWNHDPVHVG
jgi:hypothetical protein